MKSIKEKAEEHLNSVYAGYDDVLKELVKESYVSGANYVLDEIEKLVKTTDGDGETYHYNLYIGLVNLLEQLKK